MAEAGVGGFGHCGLCEALLVDVARRSCIPNCGHFFCLNCISQWIGSNSNCPTCEQPFSEVDEIDDEGETISTIIFRVGCRSREEDEKEGMESFH